MSDRFNKDHLIALDSDGCVFDGMTIKHRQAFIPAAIAVFELDRQAELYSEIAEEVNLHSNLRGINRFEALFYCLLLTRHLADSPPPLPDLEPLQEFVRSAHSLSNDALALHIESDPSEILQLALRWSETTNAAVARIAPTIPVFPMAREGLEEAARHANLMVCSASARQSLLHEWHASGVEPYATFIAGQEFGPKAKQIEKIAGLAGFPADRILMVGDAFGDLNAAREVGVRFFPILPGEENASWKLFIDTVLPAFRQGSYSAQLEAESVRKFETKLSPLRYACHLASFGVALDSGS